ncbi:hypothetical protein, partial [Carbonactinospora thermoautotrophica]|uniref:hypothetical protein n=1 Tax=Carbonactinospora thermoautotrophica TaxID=1469144 RepID=UPI001E2C353E
RPARPRYRLGHGDVQSWSGPARVTAHLFTYPWASSRTAPALAEQPAGAGEFDRSPEEHDRHA